MAVDLKIDIQDRRVEAALENLRLSLPLGGDMTPAMTGMGRALKTAAQMRFREGKGPDGTAWPESARAKAEGGQTLRLTGRLRNSITYAADHASVAVGTNVIYAAIHQMGGVIRAKNAKALRFPIGQAWATVKAVRMPARPFLGPSEADREELLRILSKHLEARWGAR